MQNEKEIIEINGVKLEVDMRYVRRIENLKVGTKVKVLVKTYSEHKVHHGVIIGFEPFESRPTIIIAYMELSFTGAEIKFLYYNTGTKDVEVVAARDDDEEALDREEIVKKMEAKIEEKRREIQDLKDRKRYFLEKFATYWSIVQPAPEPEVVGN